VRRARDPETNRRRADAVEVEVALAKTDDDNEDDKALKLFYFFCMDESGTKLPPGDARLMARWGFDDDDDDDDDDRPGDTNDTSDPSFAGALAGDRKDCVSDGAGDDVGDDVGDGEREPRGLFLLHPQLGIRWGVCVVI
jgi:hypothetical protein